jgi:hypothetical protein
MRPDVLNRFTNDVVTREEVINFIHDFIDQETLRRVYNKENVSEVADAIELIDLAFSELDNLYGIKNKATKPVNEAR